VLLFSPCCVHRLAYWPEDERPRESAYYTAARQMARTFSNMIHKASAPSLPARSSKTWSTFSTTGNLSTQAVRLIDETLNDLKSGSWSAAHNVAPGAEVAETDIRVMALHIELVISLVMLDLANWSRRIEGHVT